MHRLYSPANHNTLSTFSVFSPIGPCHRQPSPLDLGCNSVVLAASAIALLEAGGAGMVCSGAAATRVVSGVTAAALDSVGDGESRGGSSSFLTASFSGCTAFLLPTNLLILYLDYSSYRSSPPTSSWPASRPLLPCPPCTCLPAMRRHWRRATVSQGGE